MQIDSLQICTTGECSKWKYAKKPCSLLWLLSLCNHPSPVSPSYRKHKIIFLSTTTTTTTTTTLYFQYVYFLLFLKRTTIALFWPAENQSDSSVLKWVVCMSVFKIRLGVKKIQLPHTLKSFYSCNLTTPSPTIECAPWPSWKGCSPVASLNFISWKLSLHCQRRRGS